MSERAERRTALRLQLEEYQGRLCAMPCCSTNWVVDGHMAHIRAIGMGGRRSADHIDNVVGLCVYHHDVFDGRHMQGRQTMLQDLIKYMTSRQRGDRAALHKEH